MESLEVTGASRLSIFSLNDTIKDISATEGGRAVMGELMAMVGMGAGSSGMGGVPLAVGAAAVGMAYGGGSQGSEQKRSRALPFRESPAPYLTAWFGRNQ